MSTTDNWLQVLVIPDDDDNKKPAKLQTIPSCLALGDIRSDSYIRLLAVDFNMEDICEMKEFAVKLKVFRGIDLEIEMELNGLPSAIECLYVDESETSTPIVAIAIAETILFYRHLKPYFKYTLPELPVGEEEHNIWQGFKERPAAEYSPLIDELRSLERPLLCRKSQQLLLLPSEETTDFICQKIDEPLNRSAANIVALKSLARVSSGCNPAASHLVIATDSGEVLILEPQSFTILCSVTVCPGVSPSVIAVHGIYETDFCIALATRFGAIYLLRKNTLDVQEILKLANPLIGLILLPIDQTLVMAGMDQRLLCYSKKGKQLYSVALENQPICMTSINLSHLGLTLICIALDGGLVQFYMQKFLVDEFKINESVNSMIFGRLGLEENVLCLTTINGELIVKILRRIATFEPKTNFINHDWLSTDDTTTAPILDKTKKSSIFVEQFTREKQNAKATYGSFQVELWRLRHTVARATVDILRSSESTISDGVSQANIRILTEIVGVGPTFRLYITLHNISTYKMASNLQILLHADRRHFIIAKSLATIPSIMPGFSLKLDFEIVAVLDPIDKLPPPTLTPDNSHIQIMLIKAEQCKPLIATVVTIPQSEGYF